MRTASALMGLRQQDGGAAPSAARFRGDTVHSVSPRVDQSVGRAFTNGVPETADPSACGSSRSLRPRT